MKGFRMIFGVAIVASVAALFAPVSSAGVDVSFGMNAPIGDDGNLFFSISSHYFDRQPQVVVDWSRRFPNPDDLAVFLQVCSHSQQSPEVVFNYRRQGLTWYEVGARVGYPVDSWYVPVMVDPGPPYAKSYKHYRRYQHDSHYAVRLSDREVRDLVAVRMAHEYYGVAPEVAMDWRRGGSNVQQIMTREYHTRHRGPDSHGDGNDGGHDSHHKSHHDSPGHGHHDR